MNDNGHIYDSLTESPAAEKAASANETGTTHILATPAAMEAFPYASSSPSKPPTTAGSSAPLSSTTAEPRFKLVPKVKPLPSQVAAAKKAAKEEKEAKPNRPGQSGWSNQPVRAENEDDDGYDPYSDFHDAPQREPLFQADPWA